MIVANTARRRDSGLGRDDAVDMGDRLVMSQGSRRPQLVSSMAADGSIANSNKGRKTFRRRQFATLPARAEFSMAAYAHRLTY